MQTSWSAPGWPTSTSACAGRGVVAPGSGSGGDRAGAPASRSGHHSALRESGPGVAALGGSAMAGDEPMTALEQHLTDYLQLRRSLGHDLADAARLLPGLVEFLDRR